MRRFGRWLKRITAVLAVLMLGPVLMVAFGEVKLGQDWRTADRSPAGVAPSVDSTPEAVVQVYAARAFNWRGIFAVHTWIATKAARSNRYTVHQVIGWNGYHGRRVLVSQSDAPDRRWYGATPEVIADLRGDEARAAIAEIEAAIRTYPYDYRYALWPGPNSNTFVAEIGRRVPRLKLDLPVTAIGKDYLTDGALLGAAPSGTGFQLSVRGALGVLLALEEGLEINLFGLVFGLDPLGPALKLPGIGRVGFDLRRRSG